jgi:hypothetical protein
MVATISDAFVAVTGDAVMSARLAQTALYLLVGYEQALAPVNADPSTLEWAFRLIQILATDPMAADPL